MNYLDTHANARYADFTPDTLFSLEAPTMPAVILDRHRVPQSLVLDAAVRQQLAAHAKSLNVSMSSVANDALRAWLHLPPPAATAALAA